MYCNRCGAEIHNNSKFCESCGLPIQYRNNTNKIHNNRNVVFEGQIHRCPSCGEVLDSFMSKCPSCGFEIRGINTTNAIKDFTQRLNYAGNEYQKASIIRNFPVPNTKEDIFEFMIEASTNIDEHPNKYVFNAWIVKFEQCYEKAKLSFENDNDFEKIQGIYEKTKKKISKIRAKTRAKKIMPVAIIAIVIVAFWTWIFVGASNAGDKEVDRLESIVNDVETALDNKEYDLAMMYAKSIDYMPGTVSSSDLERQWDIKRDYLIKKVIAAAADDGIIMEYPTDTADEKDQTEDTTVDYNKQIQENLDKFNKAINQNDDDANKDNE